MADISEKNAHSTPPKGELYKEKPSIGGIRGFLSGLFSSLPTADLAHIEHYAGKPWSRIAPEMMRDPDIKSTFQSRLSAVPGKPWEIAPANETPQAKRIAEIIKGIIDQIPNFSHALKHLLRAIAFGHSVVEVVWDRQHELWIPAQLKLRRHSRFGLSEDGSQVLLLSSQTALEQTPVEQYKIIYHRHEPQDDAPLEEPLLYSLFWPWFFKKNAWQFWMLVAEKWGVPSVWGKYPAHFTDTDVLDFLQALRNLQQDSVAAAPVETAIEILKGEPGEKGTFFRELLEFCEKQISKAVLGGTLTQEITQIGSYAAAQTHMEVRQDIIDEDALLLQNTLDDKLISWIVFFNFGEDATENLCPGIKFNVTPGRGSKEFADTLTALHNQGVRLSPQFYIDTFGLPPDTQVVEVPAGGQQGGGLPFG